MAVTLEQIVQTKRSEVEARKSVTSIDQFKSKLKDLDRPRNFFAAVTRDPQGEERAPLKLLNVIAEVKKASPTAGVIREDFDPVTIAKKYEQGGADAISCLTDEPYFQGKLEYIDLIKQAVKLPVLRKDFIIDPWQVYESASAGADAILLIAECLATNELIDLSILATELHLTTL
ncbi:MAG TPA: indole-3-glycerol phosphate synthase TrpC, partial [Tepidisphaeraceae bacterium]|nr:indole-3-glycerol phosphate synthase TrpC [Tepidisphaeraceae bacterium]